MALKPGQAGFQGTIGNQYVGQKQWDPRGFYVIPDYGAKGQSLHVYPDGRKVVVKASATKPAATPAAPVGAAASPYNVSNLPPDAAYEGVVAGATRTRDTLLGPGGVGGTLGAARTQGLGDYGFTEGAGGQLAFDPNNPFSKAALLKKSYDQNRRSTGQSMGAGGQLYSGAFQNAQDLVNRNQLQGEDALQKSLVGFLARNTQARTQAGTDYETTVAGAAGDRVGRFQTNPLYNPAPVDDTPAAATPATPAAAAKPAAVVHEFKRVNGKLYRRVKGSTQQWVPTGS